jgi:TRAP-type mannitol/chloroaromatic compound transport system substrate-binding protein
MEKFGVSTQLLAGGDIYPALELGSIDATEFSYPSLDRNLGFYQIAKHNYFPGWHQQASLLEVIINGDKWKGITDGQRKAVEMACGEANIWSMGKAEASQGEAIAFHQSKGVTIHKWPDETVAKFQQAWDEVAQEQAASNPEFKRIYDAYTAFRTKYAPWKEMGYLKSPAGRIGCRDPRSRRPVGLMPRRPAAAGRRP